MFVATLRRRLSSQIFLTGSRSELLKTDPAVHDLIQKEEKRQKTGLELIASENFVSRAVLEALGSVMTNKYAEGYPGARYYGGNEYTDEVEKLCCSRALDLYGLNPKEWGVNVQPLSGSPANFAAYTALLKPHDRIMGLDLPDGGHLTHGFMSPTKRVSATSIYFESMPYKLGSNGLVDYNALESSAKLFRPRLIIAGASAYPRDFDYARMRAIADSVGAILMADMAHFSGLIAAGLLSSPFKHCHVVTSTTHKTLRGPRSGMIFSLKNHGGEDLSKKVDDAVFPGLQGGPHMHQIAALAVALKEAKSPEFVEYQRQVVANAAHLAGKLEEKGLRLSSGGTDNHLMLVDVKKCGTDGSRAEYALDLAHITVNKNTIQGDTKPMTPSGLRIGTPAMTTRGLKEKDFDVVADFIHRGILIAARIQKENPEGKLADFKKTIKQEPPMELIRLKNEVIEFASAFPHPSLSE